MVILYSICGIFLVLFVSVVLFRRFGFLYIPGLMYIIHICHYFILPRTILLRRSRQYVKTYGYVFLKINVINFLFEHLNASFVGFLFGYASVNSSCACPPRQADPLEFAFFFLMDGKFARVGHTSCQMPSGGDESRGQMPHYTL